MKRLKIVVSYDDDDIAMETVITNQLSGSTTSITIEAMTGLISSLALALTEQHGKTRYGEQAALAKQQERVAKILKLATL